MKSQEIAIRSIQHYLYCPHRWGLLEIDKAWAENFFVTKANLMHERVHDPQKVHRLRGRKIFTAVPVFNDQDDYNLYGVTDCLELYEDKQGISIHESKEKYRICIVEYKPTMPENRPFREDDLMQVFAQKICVDFVFGGNCEGVIYYADSKQRVKLPLQENFFQYDQKLKYILKEMRDYMMKGKIPPVARDQKCSGCSMKDLCMPKIREMQTVREQIRELIRQNE